MCWVCTACTVSEKTSSESKSALSSLLAHVQHCTCRIHPSSRALHNITCIHIYTHVYNVHGMFMGVHNYSVCIHMWWRYSATVNTGQLHQQVVCLANQDHIHTYSVFVLLYCLINIKKQLAWPQTARRLCLRVQIQVVDAVLPLTLKTACSIEHTL